MRVDTAAPAVIVGVKPKMILKCSLFLKASSAYKLGWSSVWGSLWLWTNADNMILKFCDFCVARFRRFVCSPFLLVCCVLLRWLGLWSSVQASVDQFCNGRGSHGQVWISTGWRAGKNNQVPHSCIQQSLFLVWEIWHTHHVSCLNLFVTLITWKFCKGVWVHKLAS